MSESKAYMPLFLKTSKQLLSMSDEMAGRFAKALAEYHVTGNIPEEDELAKIFFIGVQDDIDSLWAKYDGQVERSRKAAQARWNKSRAPEHADAPEAVQTNAEHEEEMPGDADASDGMHEDAQACTSMQTDADACSGMQTHLDAMPNDTKQNQNQKQNQKQKERVRASPFRAPTPEDVREYATERGHPSFNADGFVDFYKSKGWRVGNAPMKDWKAAVRNWIRRDEEGVRPGGDTSSVLEAKRRYVRDKYAHLGTGEEYRPHD